MPEISISEEQAAYVEALRDELADEVTYGHVRVQDAVQYLIDHHREDGDLTVEVDAEVEPDGGTATDAGETPETGGTADPADAGGDEGGSGDGDDGDEDDPTVIETAEALGSPGGSDGRVDEMMNLVEEHDDKWTETDGGDGRYRVDLPDGEAETVQTKDDVRALLFQHYR